MYIYNIYNRFVLYIFSYINIYIYESFHLSCCLKLYRMDMQRPTSDWRRRLHRRGMCIYLLIHFSICMFSYIVVLNSCLSFLLIYMKITPKVFFGICLPRGSFVLRCRERGWGRGLGTILRLSWENHVNIVFFWICSTSWQFLFT